MRILITSDAAGGVGVHAEALARELARRGHHLTLAIFGPGAAPLPPAPNFTSVAAPFRLEWMSDADGLEADITAARAFLARLAHHGRADLVHANHFAFVLPALPSLLAVHSDVVSWWHAVHAAPPPANAFHAWYQNLARQALAQATLVATPSHAALADLRRSFGFERPATVIANGLSPRPLPKARKRPLAVTVGRLWDEGKQTRLLFRSDLGWPTQLLGPRHPHDAAGWLPPDQVRARMAQARLYVAPSRYEPFGLACLEAALSGCALLLNDIPSFREIWGDTAVFFAPNDGDDLARQMRLLAAAPASIAAHAAAARAHARRHYCLATMADAYEALYRRLAPAPEPHHGNPPLRPLLAL